MPKPKDAHRFEAALRQVKDEESFVQKLLIDALEWPIDPSVRNVEDITYEWDKDELKAAGLEQRVVDGKARQIANLSPDQPWGIFILEFRNPEAFLAERGMTGTLRKVLRGLVPSRRKEPGLSSWKREHLLFICTHRYEHFRLAYFKAPPEGTKTAPLAAFGWGPDIPARTACEINLPALEWPQNPADAAAWVRQWSAAFDVEKVTRKFYDEYKAQFEKLREAITSLTGEDQKMFAQTLMNRLLFLRFVERKGWFEFPAGRATRHYLSDLFAAGGIGGKSFYTSRLRPLFFDALAVEGRQQGEAVGKVHFLNGGLFERSPLDDKVADLLDSALAPVIGPQGLFYRYNFTVEESTPLDIEVAVDPEMLGKVFEELVTGRHESGSYYTPRPIVAFMCREALKGYLEDKTTASAESIAALVDRHEVVALTEAHGRQIRHALDSLKALDPACGSGAYLLGLMQELIALYRLLQNEKLVPDPRTLYELKLRIISNNLYGVDIDPFATNIAMLRLWLSLAVDSDDPVPLPNLDFKIETGDSLTGPCDAIGSDLHTNVIYRLAEKAVRLKEEYLQSHGEQKARLKAEIENYRQTIARELHHTAGGGRAIDWYAQFTEVFASPSPFETTLDGRFGFAADAKPQREFKVSSTPERAGFDIVLANPPYVRQELIKNQKAALRAAFPDIYGGSVDLCCYFYGRSVQLLRPGGVLAFISSNKWMRAGYGRTVRSFLLRHAVPRKIVDFGHSPIFPAADTFPCVPVLSRRTRSLDKEERPPEGEAFDACMFPRDDYRAEMVIGAYVERRSKRIPASFLRDEAWTLDDPEIQGLLERIRDSGVTLMDHCGPLYRGPVTGLNEAFFIDRSVRDRLIGEQAASSELIKPLLRGRDIDRWRPRRSDTYIIFTRRGMNIDAFPGIKRHLAQYRAALEARAGEQAWYELQASPSEDFARVMFRPKIVYQEIQFHSWFCLETEGACVNNKVFMLPTADLALLGVLCSPLMWWFLTRTLPHMKDEALCPAGFIMENVRVTIGTDAQASAIREAVGQLVTLADSSHTWESEISCDICKAAGIEAPDERAVDWLAQPPEIFCSRLAKLAGRRRLTDSETAKASKLRESGLARRIELLRSRLDLERRLASLVEDAYQLSPTQRELIRATRPVRDPLDVLESKLVAAAQEPTNGYDQRAATSH